MHSFFRWGRGRWAGLCLGLAVLGQALVSTELAPGRDPEPLTEGAVSSSPALAPGAAAGASGFRIVGPPVRVGVSVWRVSWDSVPGRTYLLQRWSTDELGLAGNPRWTDVATVRAIGVVTTAEDPTAAFVGRRYYRVGLLPEAGGDGEAPVVSAITPKFTAANNAAAAELTFSARDNVGVTAVTVLNGSTVLGSATRRANGEWSFVLPLNPKELGARFLVARAVDAAGNIGNSPVFPLGLVDPDHFLPLGPDGLPIEGGIVPAVAAGVWGAVEYRPGGRNMLGNGPGFFLRFPRGVKLVNEAGGSFLEFTEVTAGFGARYPLQFTRPLARTTGPVRRLRVGPVNLADVLAIFDLDVAAGVEVRLYDRFPLRWHAGVVDDGGILGARFGFVSTGLPLPGISGTYPDLAVDFTRTTGVRLPFHGEFSLPDWTATPLRLRAGDANPLWLTLAPDGRVSLVGSAEVLFPDGGFAHAYLTLEEPHYRIEFEADGLHARTLNGFVDLLPPNPATCVPSTATPAQLAQASRCLDSFARAYANFSASVAGLSSADSASAATRPAAPPEPFATASSVIEAWGYGATAGTVQRLPLDLIRDVVQQAGSGAAASGDLNTTLARRSALLRALQAVRSNAATASAESAADLDTALAEAEAAGLRLASDPDTVASLEQLTETVRLLVEGEALRQAAGRPAGTLLATAVPGLLQRFADRFTTRLGVQAGVFSPGSNPIVGSMNRFVAAEQVHQLIEFLAGALTLGVDLAPTRIDEALGQLAIRLATVATQDLVAAELVDDMPGFVLAFQDLLDLVAARQLAIFPSNPAVTAGVPDAPQVAGLGARMDALLQRDLTRPLGERTFHSTAAEIRALLRVLRRMPAGVTFADASFRRAFDRMETALATATSTTGLAGEPGLANLMRLLEAGMEHSELGTRFGFASGEDWETQRLARVVGRIASVAAARRGWSELNQSVRQLLDAADRLGLANDGPGRLACLQQAAALLETSRVVAAAMIREGGGALGLADMMLPGTIRVENVAGFANYNARSRALSGSFRGALFLPKFTSAFVINNASLAPGGAFDLNVYGTAPFPGGRLTIPGRQPLHVGFEPPGDLRFRGAGRVEFESGLTFESFLTLDDPNYAFGIAAQGLRFSLGRELALRIPTLSSAQVGAFTDATRDTFQQYFRNLGATMETLVGAVTNFPAIDPTDIGRPPEFVAPQITLNLDELNALSDTFLLPAQAGLADLINSTFGAAREKLLALNREATEARDALLSERELLENQIQRLAARRKAKEAFQQAATAMAGNAEAEGKATQLLAAGTDGLREEILLTYRLVTPGLLSDLPGALRLAKVFVGYGANVQDQGASFADLDGDGVPNTTDKCPAFPENAQRDTDNDGLGDACDEQPSNAAVPGTSALAQIRRQGADVLEAGRILAFAAATNRLGQLGLGPDTGAVADAARFEGLTEDELELNSRLFLALAANSDLLGEDGGSTAFLAGARAVHRRLGALLTSRFGNALPDDYRRKYEVGRRLLWAASVAQSFGDDAYPVSASVVAADIIPVLNRIPATELAQFAQEVDLAQAQRQDLLARTVQREVAAGFRSDDLADLLDESPGFVFDLGELFRVLSLPVPAEFNTKIGDLVRYQMEQLRLRTISPDFLRGRASDAIGALDTLIGVAGWVSRNMPGDVASVTKLQTTLEAVTIPLTSVAEARKEWWVVERYYERLRAANRLYGASLSAGLRQAFGQAGTGTLLAAQRIGTAMAQLLQQVRLETVTLQLPGEVRVPQAFGSVFFNRATEQVSGSFGGRIELPGLGGTLEILNASVSNGGDFDVNAFGSLQVPVGAPIGTISIPARRPLHLSHQAPGLTSLSGGLRLDLTNGMHFEGYLGLEDPVYTFGVSAGGLKFDLIQKLIITKPVLPGLEPFRQEVATVLTEYLDRLNAGFESLAVLGDPLQLDPAGQRPDFRAPAVTLEFDAIEAFANSVNLAVTQARVASHEAAYGALKSTLGAIASGAGNLRQTLGGVLTNLNSRATDLQRQEDYNTAMEVLASALSLMAAHAEVGSPVPIRESAEFAAAMNAGRTNTVALLRSPTVVQSLPSIRRVARLALNFAAAEQLTGQAGGESVFNELPDFFEAGRSNLFVQLGLNPRTGGVANPAVFAAIPLTLLDNQVKDLIGYAADLQAAGPGAGGDELPVIQAAAGALSNRQRTLILERLCAEPGMHFHDRQFLVSTLWDLMAAEQDGVFEWPASVSRFDCTTGTRNAAADVAGLVAQSERVVRDRRIDEAAGRLERSQQQDNAILYTLSRMRVRFNFNLQNDVLAEVQRGLRAQLDRLDGLVLQPWPRDRLRDGVGLLGEIIDLAEALEGIGMPTELGRLRTITLPGITVQFTAVAEAQKAWWELSDFSRRLLRAAGRRVGSNATTLADAFVSSASASIRAADRISQAFVALLPTFERQDFNLPGDDLVIREVFGNLLYNRQTGFLRGELGGRLEFPSLGTNVFFQVNRASIATDGSFSIQAATGGPLPFGRVRLNADIGVNSTRSGGWDLVGNGQMLVPSNTSTQAFNVSLGFDQSANRLRVSTLAQNLNVRFSDDFVLFDAGFGFDVSLDEPRGRFTSVGSAGMYARNKPLPTAITRDSFQLVADGVTTSFQYEPGGFAVNLDNGTLRLPAIFTQSICPTNPPGIASGPAVLLTPGTPIFVNYRETPQSVSFGGALGFRNLGFQVPGLTNLAVEVCSARLVFPANELPRLTNLNATIQIPLPGQTNRIDVSGAAFALDGFPTGTIALRDNLAVFNQGGFEFTLLGTVTTNCNVPTALTVSRLANGKPFFRLDGGLEFAAPPEVLGSTNGGRLFARSCGFVSMGQDLAPQLQMENFALGGTIRLGGPQGLLIENAVLALDGLTNIYHPSPTRPFTITLGGFANIPDGPRLGLQGAKFSFVGETLPQFTIVGLSIAQNPEYQPAPGLFLNVTGASLVFLRPNRPFPEVLFPDNIELGLSAQVNIPPGPNPILTGRTDNLRVRLVNGLLHTELSGFGVGINNLEFPPLTLTGEVYLGGLDGANDARALQALTGAAPAARANGLFFAGKVGGTLNDVGIKALVAFDLRGPIGVCLDGNAGPAGIPLGPTGFLLTGAQGGVSFLNSNGDPCDFSTFYPIGANGRPQANDRVPQDLVRRRPGAAMSWDEYSQYLRRARLDEQAQQQISASARRRAAQTSLMTVSTSGSVADFTPMGEHAALAAAGEAPAFPCPTGDCPSPTVNILCQPHPDPDRFPNAVILKFTSLNEKTLNEFGITRSFVQGLGLTDARSIGRNVAAGVRGGIDPLVPRADPGLVGSTQANLINQNVTGFLDDLETLLAELIRVGVGAALGSSDSVYDKIVEVAHAGVPCPDATVRLAGTFSHASVSTALSATAGVVLSTTGSAGVVGTVNVMGVPVGRTRSFVSATDNRGDPNPSFCGETLIAIGPLEFGQMRSKYECPGCITGMLASFGQLTGCISDTTIQAILARVAPRHGALSTARALAALNDAEKLAFIGQIYSMPAVPGLGDCFISSARSAVDSFNPSYVLCGDVTPKLFGIPLSGSLVQANIAATRTNFAAQFAFSPSFIINNLMLCAATLGTGCQPIFPALDSASMGFGFGVPDFADAVVDAMEGKLSSPEEVARFAKDSFDHMLANATFTVGYEINPFGFKLADAEARVILPNLTEHPARPGFTYVRPEDRGQNLPSRVEVALTALEAGFLANPLWKGSADDLAQIFPAGSAVRTRVANARLSFQKDYFPHGGILGAARLAMPRMIVDAPPAALGVLLDPSKDVMTRLGAASEVLGDYVLRTSEVGTLAFYVPAPNPPFFADSQGRALTPDKLLTAIQTFDPGSIRLPNLYPLEQFFFAGYVEGRLLGVPIARADVTAVPASASGSAFFRLRAGIPDSSWMKEFVDNATMQFEIRQSPAVPIETFFGGLMAEVTRLNRPGAALDAVGALVNQVGAGVADSLPKVSLDLAVNNLRIPAALTNILTTANASARFVAYSPRFNPGFTGEGPVAEVTRRGGIAIQGNLTFANLVTVTDAQLAMFPTDVVTLPGLAGRLRVSQLGIPGAALHDAQFDFNSVPRAGEPFLAASGAIDPIDIRNPLDGSRLLSVRPLGSGSSRIAAAFSMYRGANNSVQGSFAIDPARVDFPMLGPDLRVTVHGAKPTDRFSFSTTEPWGASVTIEGQLSVRDFANKEIVRIGSSGGRFSATLTGQGFNLTSLVVSNIPTGLQVTTFRGQPFQQDFVIGGSVPAQLRINSDGTFLVSAKLGGDLNLPGLPAPALKGGASVTVTERGLSFTGEFEGGLLAPGVKANGMFVRTSGGEVSLTGSATIPAQTFGSIIIRGVSADDLNVNLFHDGYSVPNGARLQVIGVNNDLLSLSPFTNRANADFTATVRSGDFTVPGFFRMSGGRMEFRRRTGVVALEINTPTMFLLPGTPQQNRIEAPFTTMLVATDGRFYADSGQKELNLLGALKLQGRLEIGNEPGGGSPALTVSPTSLDFGTINFGTVSNRSVRFSNTGNVPLVVSLLSGSRSFVPAQNDLAIPAGEFREISLQFRPAVAGAQTNEVRVFMNPGSAQPSLTVRGNARAVPVFQANGTQISFGDVPLGSTRTSRLIVRNVGAAPMLVTNATLAGPFTIAPVVDRQTLQPGEELPLTISFTPGVLGVTNGTLTVRASDQAAARTFSIQTGNAYAERLVRLREGGPTLRGMAMLDTNTGWAVGDGGAFLRTDNGGRSWVPVAPGFSGNFRAVAVNGTRIAVAGEDGIAGVSTNAGATWRRLMAPLLAAPTNHWQSVVWAQIGVGNLANIDPGSQLVFVGARNGGGGIIAREASGAFVQALTTTNALRSIAAGLDRFVINQSARLIAVGDGGQVVRSRTGGTNWTSEFVSGAPGGLHGVDFGGTSTIDSLADAWLVGDGGLLMTATSSTEPFRRVFGPTLEAFRAVRVGYLVGDNGSAYRRFAIPGVVATPQFERESPSGAYDLHALASNDLGTYAAGQFGQIHLRPGIAPVGPFITFDPGSLDFGVQPVGRTRTLQVRVFNRGFTPLTVNRIAVRGSSAFVPSVALISRIPTNSLRTFEVRFTPGAIGDFGAELELGHDESAILYTIPLRGGCQTNAWTLVANPGDALLNDVQFTSVTTGYATTGSDIFKTTSGGTNWTELAVTPPSSVARLSFFSDSLGFVVGGTSGRIFDCAGTCLSFIQRTGDGGATWTTATTGVTTPIADLHMVSTTTGFAVGRTRSTALIGGTIIPGEVLRTTDGGTTWSVMTRPVPATGTFSGTAIHALSTTTLFVAGNGQLFRSTNGGTSWTAVLNVGSPIRDIHFVNANTGWIVGDGGLFRRTTTGGTVSTAWPGLTPFTTANLRRIHFVDANTGWIVGDDGVVGYLFRSNNGGVGWLAEFRESLVSGTTGPRAVSGTSASAVFAVNGQGVYRSGAFNPAPTGSPVLPALTDFGVLSFGTNVTRAIALRNLGDAPLGLLSLTLDDDTGEGSFQVVSPATLPIILPARGQQEISVRYAPSSIARHHVRLLVETDGGGPVLVSDLVGEAEVFPTSLRFVTEPAGLRLALDGRSTPTPEVITVVGESKVPNDVINIREWRFGTEHTVEAPPSQIFGGYEYRFQGWQPTRTDSFTILATNVPATYVARYVAIRTLTPALAGFVPGYHARRLALVGPELAGQPTPTDVPGGPYIRISGARLEIPAMGGLDVQGSAFLAGDRFEFALDGDPIGDPNLLRIDAGSWRVSFTNNASVTRFVLRAQNPGITMLNKPVTGSSEVLFDVSPNRIVAQLTTFGNTPILPAIVELGPSVVAFTNAIIDAGPARFTSFRAAGDVRLLALPNGSFASVQPFSFFASDQPFTNEFTALPTTLIDTPLIRVTRATGAKLSVSRNRLGEYGVGLTNFNLSLLGGTNTPVSGSIEGSRLRFATGRTIAFGSLRYDGSGPSSVELDFAGPSIKAVVAEGDLTVPTIAQAIHFAGFTIDSNANFDRKITLPTFDFDGIGVNDGGPIEHNFIRFYRLNGVVGVQFRDRRTFLDNTFKLAIDIDSTGRAAGTFSGSLLVRDFMGCDEIGVGDLTLRYNNAATDGFQFRGNVRLETCLVGTHDFRVKFGSAGGKFCHLFCGPSGCAEDICIP